MLKCKLMIPFILFCLLCATAFGGGMSKISHELRTRISKGVEEIQLVFVLHKPGADISIYMPESVTSITVAGFQWTAGRASPRILPKIAGLQSVISIASPDSWEPVGFQDQDFPGADFASVTNWKELKEQGKLIQTLDTLKEKFGNASPPSKLHRSRSFSDEWLNMHHAREAWEKGFNGEGVTIGVIDTGVDFGHPDLQGTQARVPFGPYEGWPFAYDTLSGLNYALDPSAIITPETYWDYYTGTMYCRTSEISDVHYGDGICTAAITLYSWTSGSTAAAPRELVFQWPDASISGKYRYTVHPDFRMISASYVLNIGYGAALIPPLVIVSDENTSGTYNTVYTDSDFDGDLTDEKPARKGDEISGADIFDADGQYGSDGLIDLSAGMLCWISDGKNPPPGVSVLYPENALVPKQGRIISFLADAGTHGTSVVGNIVSQRIITDPLGKGASNPFYAGGGESGGAGGPVLFGVAPGARIAAIQNGYRLPLDALLLSALGFDGVPQTGDEPHIVNNSWGTSSVINDGWDVTSRFIHELNRSTAQQTSFLFATGNGGPGYGTNTSPAGGSIISVGASTHVGSARLPHAVNTDQLTTGNVMSWSNRGPDMLGNLSPHVVATGYYRTSPTPLNVTIYNDNGRLFLSGQTAYGGFSGTSMSCPIAAGVLSTAVQAYYQKNEAYPEWSEALSMLCGGARDLGFDSFTQGCGDIDALESVKTAAGESRRITPHSWEPGDYKGEKHVSFASIMFPGDSVENTFTIHNPSDENAEINVSARQLQLVHETEHAMTFTTATEEMDYPLSKLEDISTLIANHDPDFVRIRAIIPIEDIDPDGDYDASSLWRLSVMDWMDMNGNGKLWIDQNEDGYAAAEEFDRDNPDGVVEYNWMNVNNAVSTTLEAHIGAAAMQNSHDGIFLSLERSGGENLVNVRVFVEFFRRTPWDMVSIQPDSLSVPSGSEGEFTASVQIPEDAPPAIHEGAILASDGMRSRLIPVCINIASNQTGFAFGADADDAAAPRYPYDNSRIFGQFDWSWRYESGDWRAVFFDLPEEAAAPGKRIIAGLDWEQVPTDVDVFAFGPVVDGYSSDSPEYFGPYSQEQICGSHNSYLDDGRFFFDTYTGEASERLSCESRSGLNFLAMHNVLYSGKQNAEEISGKVFSVEAAPWPVEISGFKGTENISFSSGSELPGGIRIRSYGFRRPYIYENQSIQQDNALDPCTAKWVESFSLKQCGLMDISTTGPEEMDIDVYLYQDNGDGMFVCGDKGDELIARSITPDAGELIRLSEPDDGLYWLTVHGWSIPDDIEKKFDLRGDIFQGGDLEVSSAPAGPVSENASQSIEISWNKKSPGLFQGILMIDGDYMRNMLFIPVILDNEDVPWDEWMFY